MANNDIRQRIVLDGEKEYRQALQDANRNLKTLRTALKAETAELGANATAQQKNQVKVKNLTAQIEEQEKVVKTYREALEEVKKKYGDNEAAVAQWEQKLNTARATLAEMKNQLDATQTGMQGVAKASAESVTATNNMAQAMERVGEFGASASEKIESIFTGLLDTISGVVQEIWGMITDAAAKADELSDYGAMYGADAVEVQKYANAIASVNDNFSDLQGIVRTLSLGGDSKRKSITEMLGISGVNFESDWEYAIAVMNRMFELQKEGQDLTPLYETVFGAKKAEGVMDLVNDWGMIQGKLATFDAENGGFGMTQEELERMQQVQLMVSDMETKWQSIQQTIAAAFAPVVLELGVSASGALEGINDLLRAENPQEREAALQKVRENVEQFCRDLAKAIKDGLEVLGEVGAELSESDDPVVAAIGGIFKTLTDSLQWMIDNKDAVKIAFEAIFGAWLIGKLAQVASKLGSIVTSIQTIMTFKDWKMPTDVPTTAPTTGGGGGGGGGAGTGFFAGLGAKISGAVSGAFGAGSSFSMMGGLSTLGPIGALLAAGVVAYKGIEANLNDENLNAIYGGSYNGGEGNLIDTMSEAAWDAAARYFSVYQDTGSEEAMTAREDLLRQLEAEGYVNSEQGVGLLEQVFEEYLKEMDPDGLIQRIEQTHPDFFGGNSSTLPADWWQSLGNGITSSDLSSFRSLPEAIAAAAQRGTANGVSNISVTMDGYVVGRLVAPYVGRIIAADMVY